ncbi:MAG: hypothetical protein H6502_00445 [Candidatus Woesearchaeota archaeon]|nr:MAG: hypothetical protein H6502_00445 [Candidatus Woesearchaeota archaeon]
MTSALLYDDNLHLYAAMLNDIAKAKKYIYLETFTFGKASIGRKFLTALVQKAKQNVKVKLLLDDYGSWPQKSFFADLVAAGGTVRFFRKIKYHPNIIGVNNHRNHRKLLLIDDKISYIGSSNLATHMIGWRELTLRLEAAVSSLKQVFMHTFNRASEPIYKRKKRLLPVLIGKLKIIADHPSLRHLAIRKEQLRLIHSAQSSIYIEMPYFLADRKLRRALQLATRRGVQVTIVLPTKSDSTLVDILREKYFGKYADLGIRIYFYKPDLLHAKLLFIDEEEFCFGSANMDYRSLWHQFELNVVGGEKEITAQLVKHMHGTLKESEPFIYEIWKKRSILQRFFELLLTPFRYLL